jgi:hypothetical protein
MMNYLLSITIGVLFLSCAPEAKKSEPVAQTKKASVRPYGNDPYTLKLKLDSISSNTYLLTLDMDLSVEAYYVSPLSPGTYTGIFDIIMDDNSDIQLTGKMTEDPISVESRDPFQGNPVNFVTQSTTHTQKIIITNSDNFTVRGKVQFTIEPKCTLEENWFSIHSNNGVISLKY